MPYSMDNPPDRIKMLPQHGQAIFVAAYNSAEQAHPGDEQAANSIAWAAVENVYEKDAEGNWVEKKQRSRLDDFIHSVRELLDRFTPKPEPEPQPSKPQTVIRQADGKYRWFGVAATAVINHDGMIDSRALFDSFIRHIERTGEYPKYDVFHFGDSIVVGQTDFVTRDGAVYFASGTFNDDEFSQAVARGLEADPEYWGHSIAFLSGQPDKVTIYDQDVPVFTDGINQFISIVPRSRAASMFTDVTVQERNSKMMDDKQFAELKKLVGEELATKKRDELTQLNRTIDEAGLIQRAQAEAKTETKPTDEPKPDATPAAPVAEIRTDEPKPADEKPVEQAAGEPTAPDAAAFAELKMKVDELESKFEQLASMVAPMQESIEQMRKPVEERISNALADATEPKTPVITRAREARKGDDKIDPTDTLAKLSAQRPSKKY